MANLDDCVMKPGKAVVYSSLLEREGTWYYSRLVELWDVEADAEGGPMKLVSC